MNSNLSPLVHHRQVPQPHGAEKVEHWGQWRAGVDGVGARVHVTGDVHQMAIKSVDLAAQFVHVRKIGVQFVALLVR